MRHIFVNLKRFDIPRSVGGVCRLESPAEWIESVLCDSVKYGLGEQEDVQLVYFLPESLIYPAQAVLARFPAQQTARIAVGCQGVHREDVSTGGNFGAFTTSRTAKAMRAAGCSWSIIGHSEERREKLSLLANYDPRILQDGTANWVARAVICKAVRAEVECALGAGLRALVCVGETADEKGDGSFIEQQPRIAMVLREQLAQSLPEFGSLASTDNLVIGYEPIWAIGPGKTPPGEEYIAFVAGVIREFVEAHLGFLPQVVYGGGLKEENAAMIAQTQGLGGGLVALTRFSGEIGFYPEELKQIITRYTEANR